MPTTIKPPGRKVRSWNQFSFREPPSPTAARALLKLQFSTDDIERMHELSAKARAGTLSPDEEEEISTYERVGAVLDILHSQARQVLKRRSR
jgi:hypothetical protein